MGVCVFCIVICAVVRDNEVLMIQRAKDPYKGYWSLPGGKIENREHPEQAAEREVFEESGIRTRCKKVACINSETYAGDVEGHFLSLVCLLDYISGEISIGNEGIVQWFPISSLPEKIVPNDPLLLKEALNGSPIKIIKSHLLQKNGSVILERFEHEAC